MNWVVSTIHKYNDYVVVIVNLEFFILGCLLAKPVAEASKKLTEEEVAQESNLDRMRENMEIAIILYLNFLAVKQVVLSLFYDIVMTRKIRKQLLT
mmetsp:Transcript_5137/g.7882  ORF Transcript_5137/g.7882 Transcript_5137/m.7882 type:complete len:96 (-) Transcript_5137:923-1210(-)